MNTFAFVTLIVLIGCATGVVYEWLRLRSEKGRQEPDEDLLARIDVLEDRIRVLERIVTENKVDLKKEIDAL